MTGALVATLAAISLTVAQAPMPYSRISEEAFQSRMLFFSPGENPDYLRITRESISAKTVYREFVFRGALGRLVPGAIEIPTQAQENPVPLVILFHYWTGGQHIWWEEGNDYHTGEMRKALLDAGFAVVAIDAPMHGNRRYETDFLDLDTPESYYSLNEIVLLSVKDCRRLLNYFDNNHKELNIDGNRYGVLGYSMGGVSAFCLQAVDPRVKFGVTCVPPLIYSEYGSTKPVDYTWGIKGKPLLMLLGKKDDPEYYKEAEVNSTYKAYIETPESKLVWYDASHQLPKEYIADVISWLKVSVR